MQAYPRRRYQESIGGKMKIGLPTTSSSVSPVQSRHNSRVPFHSTSRVSGKQDILPVKKTDRALSGVEYKTEKHLHPDKQKGNVNHKRRELFAEEDETLDTHTRGVVRNQIGLKDIVNSTRANNDIVYKYDRQKQHHERKRSRRTNRSSYSSSSSYSPGIKRKIKTSTSRIVDEYWRPDPYGNPKEERRSAKSPFNRRTPVDSPVIARKTVRRSDSRPLPTMPKLTVTVSEDSANTIPPPKIFKSATPTQVIAPLQPPLSPEPGASHRPSPRPPLTARPSHKLPTISLPQVNVSASQESSPQSAINSKLQISEKRALPKDIEDTRREILREKMLGKRLVVDIDNDELECLHDGVVGSTAPSQNHTATGGEDPLKINGSGKLPSSSAGSGDVYPFTATTTTTRNKPETAEKPNYKMVFSGDPDSVMSVPKDNYHKKEDVEISKSKALLSKIIEENLNDEAEGQNSKHLGTSFGSLQREVEESLKKIIAKGERLQYAEIKPVEAKSSQSLQRSRRAKEPEKPKSGQKSIASLSRGKTALIAALENTDSVMEASRIGLRSSQVIIPKDPQLEKAKGLLLMQSDSEATSQLVARQQQNAASHSLDDEEEASVSDSEELSKKPKSTNKEIGNEILSHFIKGDVVGEGGNSVVNLIVRKETGKEYALKTCKEKTDPRGIQKEYDILRKLRHRYVIQAFIAHSDDDESFLILEYFRGQNLHQYIRGLPEKKVGEEHGREIVRKIVEALHYLHENKLGHRDIKLENVLINEEGDIRLIDFAYSDFFEPNTLIKGYCGTPSYMSPEIYRKERYCPKKADIWALGVLIHKLVLGGPPFQGNKKNGLLMGNILKCKFKPERIKGISEELRDILARTINPVAPRRPTTRELLDHPWLKQEPILLTDEDIEGSSSSA